MQVSITTHYICWHHIYSIHSTFYNFYHNVMSIKRSHTGEAVEGANLKFQLEQNGNAILYAVVSKFNNIAYVHLRKYYNDLPSKFGVCLPVKCWYDFVKFLQDPTNPPKQFSTKDLDCRKTKNGSINFNCEKKDLNIYIKKSTVDSLILR